MPRRGEFEAVADPGEPQEPISVEAPRIGRRVAVAAYREGTTERVLDPGAYACSTLVAQLADEWVDYMALTRPHYSTVVSYQIAVKSLAEWADKHAEAPQDLSMDGDGVAVVKLLLDWTRKLPSGYKAGSQRPSAIASQVRSLMQLRAERPGTAVAEPVLGLLAGPPWMRVGMGNELDEFSRKEKKALIRAAWADVRQMDVRLERGRNLLARATGHPEVHGWQDPANLLWALAEGAMSGPEIRKLLPSPVLWSKELSDLAAMRGPVQAANARHQLIISLANLLYPRRRELHAFRVLLTAATGASPEEITGLTEDDAEFTAGGVKLRMIKLRARRVRTRTFRGAQDLSFPDHGTLNVAEIVTRMLAVTERARQDYDADPAPLFLQVAVSPAGEVSLSKFHHTGPEGSIRKWVGQHGLKISEPINIRRMRKSVKVEKAIAYRGVVSDIADDHTVQTYRGHYAHGTTLHVISGATVNRAQERWLKRALEGPVVLDEKSSDELKTPPALQALGLTSEQAEEIRTGELDMGVTSCRDPYASPFNKAGELCAVAPLRCLECRNAFILPSNLPQLLLFADHLNGLRKRLSPPHFHTLWGQSEANLKAVLGERTPTEIDKARRQIETQGLRLQLPLSAYTEFDR
ncbi:hypothetical protein ACWD4V_06975 [Streptomyces tsukubensis]